MIEIEVESGLIKAYDERIPLSAPMADKIARANGFAYAEQFVKKYEGQTLELKEPSLEIKPKTPWQLDIEKRLEALEMRFDPHKETTNNYKCGHCGYEGPCYGIPTGEGVSAPFCHKCERNDKLEKVSL